VKFPFATGVITPDPSHVRCKATPLPKAVGQQEPTKKNMVQSIYGIYDQRNDPACIGYAAASVAWALAPWLNYRPSGKYLWLDSQRFWLQNAGIDPAIGSFPYCGFLAMVKHGLAPYFAGEEGNGLGNSIFQWDGEKHKKASWEATAKAFDNRVAVSGQRYRIATHNAERTAEVKKAVEADLGILICTGLKMPFANYRADKSTREIVLDPEFLGGNSNLHAMRLAGYRNRDYTADFLLVNSWGPDWGGCRCWYDLWMPGCCWVSEDVLWAMHDIWCIDLSKEEEQWKA
jgi:hypothetical protein